MYIAGDYQVSGFFVMGYNASRVYIFAPNLIVLVSHSPYLSFQQQRREIHYWNLADLLFEMNRLNAFIINHSNTFVMKRIFMSILFAALMFTGCNKEKKLVESLQGFWQIYHFDTPEGPEDIDDGPVVVLNEHSFYITEKIAADKCQLLEEHGYSSNDGKKITSIVTYDGEISTYQFELASNGELLLTQSVGDIHVPGLARRVPEMEIIFSKPI